MTREPLQPVIRSGPEGRLPLRITLRELFQHRELLYAFASRDIRVRYKQSVLGFAWAVLGPLTLMVVFTLIFGRLARIDTGDIPYPIFSYAGLLPWTFTATALSFAVPSLASHADLLSKTHFPKEVLPLATIVAAAFDFLVASSIFFALMLYYSVPIHLTWLWVPIIFAVQVIAVTGPCIFFSALNVNFRDVKYVVPLFVQVWMFMTPVIYPATLVPEGYRAIYMLNPMAGIIESYRRAVLHGMAPVPQDLAIAAAVSLAFVVLAYPFFKKTERIFADVV